MFTKRTNVDVKKSTQKIQDYKKDSTSRLRHIRNILDFVDTDEAQSLFTTNYSQVYYILYDTFIQAELSLKQRVHKAHREELDGSLWLLGKILCFLPELLARGWQCHSLARIIGKLLHPGNNAKLRREGVKYFLLWYQALGENAPNYVHAMFAELVPGLIIPKKGGPSEEFNTSDFLNHPNMKGELGGSVFHDTHTHPIQNGEIFPLLPPSSNERTASPDPRDGLELLLRNMIHTIACLKWRDNTANAHMKSFAFLLQRFKDVYLPVFCPNFSYETSIYDPELDLPTMRVITKKEDIMSSCVVVLVNWLSKFTYEKSNNNRLYNVQLQDEILENVCFLNELRSIGYTQEDLARDVLYSTRDNINFVNEVYRQAFLLGFTSKGQIEAIKVAIAVYREWITSSPPPFLLEPDTNSLTDNDVYHRHQKSQTDGSKENYSIRAGMQNVLQVFITNAANVFLIQTEHLNIVFPSKSKDYQSSPLNEQTDICKKVLNVYRAMVMNTRMDPRTWEQLLLVLLQVTSTLLSPQHAVGSRLDNLGSRLGQAIFQTLIVTWIRAHTNVTVNVDLWDKFLEVLSTLTHRDELIVEWDKTMQTLTRVLARYVYSLNLQDLPLDRLADTKNKRKRFGCVWQQSIKGKSDVRLPSSLDKQHKSDDQRDDISSMTPRRPNSGQLRRAFDTPLLNRSYSEGSLASIHKSIERIRMRDSIKMAPMPSSVDHSLNIMVTPTSKNNSRNALDYSHMSANDSQSNHLRRALSLDSIQLNKQNILKIDTDTGSCHESRSPSPTASSGIEGASIKDSPMQIDVLTVDSSNNDGQEDLNSASSDRRPIILGGGARGWLPDVAAIMWKRMLGALGDVNSIPQPEVHSQVFKFLVEMTRNLIKIKQNQGISADNQFSPAPLNLTPPIGIVAPWCYCASKLEKQFKAGQLWSTQLLCMLAVQESLSGMGHLPLLYHVLHHALTGENRDIVYTVLKYLEGPKILSLLLPGHTLLLLDLIHASAVLLTSSETEKCKPRAEAVSLIGSLLCYPSSILPKPVLQPTAKQINLMECPDIQDHVLNIVLRCARREPSSKARCFALSQLGQWALQKLSQPPFLQNDYPKKKSNEPYSDNLVSRIKEVIHVLLQALQFKHPKIAITAADSLKLCAERCKELALIDKMPNTIITSLCKALEIQNISHITDSNKIVLTSLILCLGEFCMSLPFQYLFESASNNKKDNLVLVVLRVLYQITNGLHSDRIKLLTADENFDMSITFDDISETKPINIGSYHFTETTTQNCILAIKLCSKAIAMHLVTHLGHFPMGIGASRLSSLVEEQDDAYLTWQEQQNARDSIDVSQILNAQNVQFFMLTNGLIASFIELSMLNLPGGGAAAGLSTAEKQVRILFRDLNGKACWDASILYGEPKNNKTTKKTDTNEIQDNLMTIQYDSHYDYNYDSNVAFDVPLDPLISTMDIGMGPPRHTIRHRSAGELPMAKNIAPDLDQLDDLLQYVGYTSPECVSSSGTYLNSPGVTPLGTQLETLTISVILNQRTMEHEHIQKQTMSSLNMNTRNRRTKQNSSLLRNGMPFQYCRLFFSHLGLASWDRRNRMHLLCRTEKLLRELRNVDIQICRETHKMAVIYVASGQEDKNSILKNTCGSSTYEMFISALGWEIELESHTGFLGGLPRQGCGATAPYYATPFLEVIYHVATRMPSDTQEAILTKTRHLGNDEVHIVWSEHYREYRRDILPTEFCDILITIYPLKSGLFRITVNRKPDVPWFGPLSDESIVSGAYLASLVRATAINASRAKRSSLPFFQQFYEERNRSLETVSTRYKESTSFENFIQRVYNPIPMSYNSLNVHSTGNAPLAAALLDHHRVMKGFL